MLVRQKTYEENNAKLYMVGVPIGNYDDMSYRAVLAWTFNHRPKYY